MKTKLTYLERRHNRKVDAKIAEIERDVKEREAKGEVITEIVLSEPLFRYEFISGEEAIKEAENELENVEKRIRELKEEQKWRGLCLKQ